jgi:phosphoribosylformylglycinamidine cyclo-ligase
MGVGLIMAVSADEADKALAALKKLGETPFLIGECVSGEKGVELV